MTVLWSPECCGSSLLYKPCQDVCTTEGSRVVGCGWLTTSSALGLLLGLRSFLKWEAALVVVELVVVALVVAESADAALLAVASFAVASLAVASLAVALKFAMMQEVEGACLVAEACYAAEYCCTETGPSDMDYM